jgi:hypothetical protein
LFYRRELNDELCPIIGGRRIIPREYLSIIRMVLRKRRRPVNREEVSGAR